MQHYDNIKDIRQVYMTSWVKFKQSLPLEPLEEQLVNVIRAHPEYHALLESDAALDAAYLPELGESNPFLHMGLHLAIQEQVTTNRPQGIAAIYQTLLKKHADKFEVEHLMMEPLAEALWTAQRNQCMPDESAYLSACQRLIEGMK